MSAVEEEEEEDEEEETLKKKRKPFRETDFLKVSKTKTGFFLSESTSCKKVRLLKCDVTFYLAKVRKPAFTSLTAPDLHA